MLFPFKYMYLIHLKAMALHITRKFVQMPWRSLMSEFYSLVSTQERWAHGDNNKQTRILGHNFPKEIPPSSHDATIPIPSKHGYIFCTKLIMDSFLCLSTPPQVFLDNFHVCWFYGKVKTKKLRHILGHI